MHSVEFSSLEFLREEFKNALEISGKLVSQKCGHPVFNLKHLFYETAWSILFWNHKNDVTNLLKFCMENTSRKRVFSVNIHWACDVIFMVSK